MFGEAKATLTADSFKTSESGLDKPRKTNQLWPFPYPLPLPETAFYPRNGPIGRHNVSARTPAVSRVINVEKEHYLAAKKDALSIVLLLPPFLVPERATGKNSAPVLTNSP